MTQVGLAGEARKAHASLMEDRRVELHASREVTALREWYYGDLRPKLARAAQAGVVPSPKAQAFDLEFRELLAQG